MAHNTLANPEVLNDAAGGRLMYVRIIVDAGSNIAHKNKSWRKPRRKIRDASTEGGVVISPSP